MFMDFLGYGNRESPVYPVPCDQAGAEVLPDVELYSEEISRGGEGLGVSDI